MAFGSAVVLVMAMVMAFLAAWMLCRLFFDFSSVEGVTWLIRSLTRSIATKTLELPVIKRVVANRNLQAERRRLVSDMPQALRLLCLALNSGSSLANALEYVGFQMEGPAAEAFRRVVWDLQAGQGFNESMRRLRSGPHGEEFAHLAVAMEIQHRSGGSLSSVLESVLGSLEQSAALHEELITKTSQARLSARVVAVMPVIVVGVLSLFSPGYLQSFLGTTAGVALFALAVLLECAGIFMVRRTLSLDTRSAVGVSR